MSLLCKYRRGWHSTFRLLKPTFPMRNKTKVEQVCQKIIRISSLKCTIWSSNHRYNLGHHPSCKGVYIYIYVWPALELWNHPTNHLPAYNCCSCHKVLLAIPNVLGWFHHHCSLMWVPKDPHNCWFPEFGIKPYNFSESQKKLLMEFVRVFKPPILQLQPIFTRPYLRGSKALQMPAFCGALGVACCGVQGKALRL